MVSRKLVTKTNPSNKADFHSGYTCFDSKIVFGEFLASDIVVKDTKINLSSAFIN